MNEASNCLLRKEFDIDPKGHRLIAQMAPKRLTWRERRKVRREVRREEKRQQEASRMEHNALCYELSAEASRVAKLHTEAPRPGIYSVFTVVAHYQKIWGWPLVELDARDETFIWGSVDGAVMLQIGYRHHWGVEYPFFMTFYPQWFKAEILREHIAALRAITSI